MKHLSKVSIAGAILLSFASISHADPAQSGSQDPTSTSASMPGTSNTQSSTDSSAQSSSAGSQQSATAGSQSSKSGQNMQNPMSKNSPIVFTPDNMTWQAAPKWLPYGAQLAYLEGSNTSKGPITIRVKVPANYQIAPITAQNPLKITIISGSANVGFGDKFDNTAGTALPAGSFAMIPARKHHYMWTTEDTIVQISGTGPFTAKYVNPKDDPSRNASSTGQAGSSTGGNAGVPTSTSGSSNTGSSSSSPLSSNAGSSSSSSSNN